MNVEGRTWVFGDNINTDLMYPSASFKATEEERCQLVFSTVRPDWSAQVREGDILVAGENFGTGSGRPAPRYLRMLGIRGIVAESVNGLFFRNSFNYALPILECPGVRDLLDEGDVVSLDFVTGVVANPRTGRELQGLPIPEFLLEIVEAGGVLQRLIDQGYVDPPPNHLPLSIWNSR